MLQEVHFNLYILGVSIRSICISMTFELTGNICALLLVDVAHALGQPAMWNKVWDGWQSVHWKSSREWARFWTPQQTWGYGRFLRRPFFASLATLLFLKLIDLATDFTGSGCCLCFHFCIMQSPSFFFGLITVFFFHFDVATMRPLAPLQR